jgi:hypothetical protein
MVYYVASLQEDFNQNVVYIYCFLDACNKSK